MQQPTGDADATKSADDAPFPLTDADRWVLSLTDEQFPCHDWADMTDIICTIPFLRVTTLCYPTTSRAMAAYTPL